MFMGDVMNTKKKVMILVIFCLLILAGAFIADRIMGTSYFNEISYDEIMKKIENKEDVVLLISQTTCSHCISYKPKLRDVANKHKLDVYYIEVDLLSKEESTELKKHVNFEGTPVTVFIKNGEETSIATRIDGNKKTDVIEKKLKSNGFID